MNSYEKCTEAVIEYYLGAKTIGIIDFITIYISRFNLTIPTNFDIEISKKRILEIKL